MFGILLLVKLLTAAHQHATQLKYQAAAQSLSKAAMALPMDTDVHLCLAGMLLQAGNNTEAVSSSTSTDHLLINLSSHASNT